MDQTSQERPDSDAPTNWWDGVKQDRLVRTAALSLVVFFSLLLVQHLPHAPLPPVTSPNYMEFHSYGMTIIAMVAIGAWNFSVIIRCSDSVVTRHVTRISLLLLFWLAVVLVKYPATNARVIEFLWYLYYIPFEAIPLAYLFIGLRTAGLERASATRWLKAIATTITALMIVLVLTNALHHGVFSFDISSPGWESNYAYEAGYYLVLGWDIALYAGFFFTLFFSARKSLRASFAVILAIVAVAAVYTLMYILRVDWIFAGNIALSYSVLMVLMLEFCLELGILPSCVWQRDAFLALPLDVKVLDRSRRVVFATDIARPMSKKLFELVARKERSLPQDQVVLSSPAEGLSYAAYTVDGGIALVTKDVLLVQKKHAELERKKRLLDRQLEALERQRHVQERFARQGRELELMADVEDAIADAMGLAEELLSRDVTSDAERRDILNKVRLLMSYCKRRGAIALSGDTTGEFERDKLQLVLTEGAEELRIAGVDCAAVVDVNEPVSARSVSLFYDACYEFSKLCFACSDPVMMVCVQQGSGHKVAMSCNLEAGEAVRAQFAMTIHSLRESLDARGASFELEQRDDGAYLLLVGTCGRVGE